MNPHGIRRLVSIVPLLVFLIFAVPGCTQSGTSCDVGQLPPGYAVVFAAPAGKTIGVGNAAGRTNAVPEPVVFRFRREGKVGDVPVHLDLIGAVDQSVRMYPAMPGTYRLVEAYLLARPGETRWSFAEAPNVLEVRDGEAVYVGTLHWRDTWVEIDNNESEARAVYRKNIGTFERRLLDFATRLVTSTRFSR